MELLRSSAFLTLIILQSLRCSDAEEKDGDKIQADYFFIVDASTKISATDFKKQLDFVNSMIHDLGIDQKKYRCGLLTYGNRVSTEFGFNSFHNQKEIVNAVSKATQLEGSGGTEFALRRMLGLFEKHGKPGTPVVGILFMHETSTNIKATIEQAQIAHKKGIIIFGVAIGSEVDEKVLTSIVSQPELILRVDSITNIEQIRIVLKKKTQEQVKLWTPPTPTNSPITDAIDTKSSKNHIEADFIFVVDASVKISASDFRKQLSFVNDFIHDLAIDQKVSRCALLTFGSEAHTEFEFLSFQSQTEISSAIFNVTQREGSGGTDRGIQQMLKLLEKRDKPDIPMTAIIFIREKSTNVQTTIEQAQMAHRKGVIIFAVAIGSEVDGKMLSSIVTEKKFIFQVETYERLTIIRYNITKITTMTLESWTKNPTMPTSTTTDAVTEMSTTSTTVRTTEKTTTSSTVKDTTMPTTLSTTEGVKIPTISSTVKVTEMHNNSQVQVKFDIIFAVDVSITITDLNLLNQLSFLKLVIRSLSIDQSAARCGIVTFGNRTRTFLELATYKTQLEIMDIVASVIKIEGSGSTDLALQRMLTMFEENKRIGVVRVGVVFTHQKSNDMKATIDLADAAHKKGIVLFVVAIGSEIDDREIDAIASRSEFVIKVESYEYLVRIANTLTKRIKEVVEHVEQLPSQPPPNITPKSIVQGGPIKADFIFLVDVSITISITEITTQLSFLNSVISKIGIDQTHSRCGLVTYGSTAMTEFGFSSYHRREEIITAVSSVTRMEGSGGTDLALRRMLMMWKESRQESSRVAYVFMHGKSSNVTATIELAEITRKRGIDLFAVGIGSQVDERELGSIASKKEFKFKVESYVELNVILKNVTQKTLEAVKEQSSKSPTDQNTVEGNPADVLFILGNSATGAYENVTFHLDFLRETVRLLKVSKSETHVGILTFGKNPYLLFGLNSYLTVTEIQSAVTRIVQQIGGSNTGKALKYARENAFGVKDQRIGARKVIVLITNSKSSDLELTIKEATLLKSIGVTLFTIGVGTGIDKNELASVASGPSGQYTFTVKDYTSLEITVNEIIVSKILQGSVVESVCRKTKSADIIFSLPNNIDYQEKKNSLRFLEAMVTRLDIGLGPTHFGMAPCHCDCGSTCGFSLSDEWGRDEISRFVSNFTKSEQSDEVAKALSSLRRGGFCLHSDAEIAKIALVVIDRRSARLTKAALTEARLLKEKGIRIYLVAVGERSSSYGADDLTSLASCFDCATNVVTYERLVDAAEKVASNLVNDLCVAFAN